jgi:hypothetical protein
MKDNLPQPGTDEHGEKYNSLPTEPTGDFPVLDLGDTTGTDFENHYIGLMDASEAYSEESSPVESLPESISAANAWSRKFDKNGGPK